MHDNAENLFEIEALQAGHADAYEIVDQGGGGSSNSNGCSNSNSNAAEE